MATNLSDHVNLMKPSESPNPDYSPSLHRSGHYDDHEEYGNINNSQQSSWKSRDDASGFEDDASFAEGGSRIHFSLKSTMN